MSQPPPPPPHGEAPKSSGLPPGKYDIFVIPQHSAGSGFLYLPSLQPNINSFAAGFACALMMVALFQTMAPAFQVWWSGFHGMGNMGMSMLIVAVGVGAWALGRTQHDPPNNGGSRGAGGTGFNSGPAHGPPPSSGPEPSAHSSGPPPPPPPHNNPPPQNNAPPPKPSDRGGPSWQQRPPPQQPGASRAETPKGSWEKAREEMRRKEEERKAREDEQRKREDAARRLRELREREAREREQREREARERKERQDRGEKDLREKLEREQREREMKERLERDKREQELKERLERESRQAKDLEERLEKERQARERLEKERQQRLDKEKADKERLEKERKEQEERERIKKEQEAAAKKASSAYAFSGVGERTNPWPNGKPSVPAQSPPPSTATSKTAYSTTTSFTSPNDEKRPPAPTAKSYAGTDDDAFSYRPYDKPKRPARRKSHESASEASWAPSQTTARTTPPPSFRGPYTTKDPDKIVIKAVYLFMNQFAKTPASQLVSGVGSVTDGLILRVTTEGLFIDDDVRGVPQREWDVKAWTLKLVEVWCPPHCLTPSPGAKGAGGPNVLHKMANQRVRAADRGVPKAFTGDDADAYLTEMLRACKDCCRLGLCETTFKNTNIPSPSGQAGEWKAKGLHLLRATIRDQEGKRYLFVLSEEESWKVSVGLQRLRRGTQARALGVSPMNPSDARGTLELLGWM